MAEKSLSDLVGERVSRFAGSLWFVIVQLIGFAAWATWNTWAPTAWRFDPYPYNLLTFFVSFEGVLIASFVLIAQNRMARQSDRRAHLNLQVDLLTEQELTLVLRLLRQISQRLDVPAAPDDARRADQLTEETNLGELMQTLERELPEEEG